MKDGLLIAIIVMVTTTLLFCGYLEQSSQRNRAAMWRVKND